MIAQLSLDIILVFAAAWAVLTDVKRHRIPNWLTFGAAVAGLALRLAVGGGQSLLTGAEGWLLGSALLWIPFVLGWMGAGDVKLLAAFGALGGPAFVLQAALAGCLIGGGMAIYHLLRQGQLHSFLGRFLVFSQDPLHSALESRRHMPFGPALALGAVASMAIGFATR